MRLQDKEFGLAVVDLAKDPRVATPAERRKLSGDLMTQTHQMARALPLPTTTSYC